MKSKQPPRAKSKKLPEVDGLLTIFYNPDKKNTRVVVKLDKEEKSAVFAGKNLKFKDSTKNVLVVNDEDGAVGLVLGTFYPSVEFDVEQPNLIQEALIQRNLEINSPRIFNVGLRRAETTEHDEVVYVVGSYDSSDVTEQRLLEIVSALPVGGRISILSHKKRSGVNQKNFMQKLLDTEPEDVQKGMGGFRIYTFVKNKPVGETKKGIRQKVVFDIFGETIFAETEPALFSRDSLDRGTRFLLEAVTEKAMKGKKILDLGCGWGAIGLSVLTLHNSCQMTMVDVNPRVVNLCRDNIQGLGFENRTSVVLTSDVRNLDSQPFDLILTNPPFHERKDVLIDLFSRSKSVLKKGGSIILVVENSYVPKFRGILKRTYGAHTVFKEGPEYTLLEALK